MIALLAIQASVMSSAAQQAPACGAAQIALSVDGMDGDFNAMSHSGTLLALRNRGRSACVVPALPVVTVLDRRGHALPVVRQVPVGLHPGPVMMPVTIAPGAVVSTPLRWVSGAVYDRSRCFTPAGIAVTVGGRRLRGPIAAHVCGPAGKNATFEQPPLRNGTATGV